MKTHLFLSVAFAVALALAGASSAEEPAPGAGKEGLAVATFAAGCFWCVESDFDKVEGVVETISGYTGGHTENPTYEDVGSGGTGHRESVAVTYDPKKVSYEQLLDHYWRHVDLLDGGGQFCDRGDQYSPAIFTHTGEQKRLAEESKAALQKSGRFKEPIAVEIIPASAFTPAEDYHQDYYRKNPLKYKFYRYNCGRDQRLAALWGKDATH
ncbi:MAG TPA: peptide-methionine (S)-S-oxide reductase MsrA [Hyphomicrobiaceae bacterium]|nr:peptide-methionine (S)-S-oxide reductase MsrA [Hyphomicrobiaceae bacterium]